MGIDDADHVLSIDLGTGGPKVAVVGVDGSCRGWASRPVATTLVDGDGAEQDPVEMWAAVCAAAADVLTATGHPALAAVAVTSQYMSTVAVRADGTPAGPCVLWMDGRGAPLTAHLLTDDTFMLFAERHGLIPLPSGHDNVAHIAVLRRWHPHAYAEATAFVEPMDYLTARLTGRVTATQSSMFGQLVCDNRTWGAVEYDEDLVAATELDPARLAPLVPMGSIVGEVTFAAASQLGVAAGLPVLAGTIDSITSAVGTGALSANNGGVIVGTTSVLVTHIAEQRNDLLASLLTVPSPVPQSYYVMAENGVGGKAFEWARTLLGENIDSALTSAGDAPPGAAGVRFAPWLAGSIAPVADDQMRGAWIGLGLEHDRRHALRAVLEGIAGNLGWLKPAVEAFTGLPFVSLRFGGGGAQSALLAQLLADAFDMPVGIVDEPRATNARGAALLAWAQIGRVAWADLPSLVPVGRTVEPSGAPVMAAVCRDLQALHAALQSMRS
jgi:xylulokinase